MASRRVSPLAMLLGAALFLSSQVLAVTAVLGVDLGTEYIKAALVKPGIPLEIVLTKDSRRKETSAVAFKPLPGGPKEGQFPERAYGADAMAISARFPGEVYPNLKTLLGLPSTDPVVQQYAESHPAMQLEPHPSRGTVTFKTKTLPAEEDAWMVEELLAMELQSIQKSAEATAGDGSPVRSVVLTVPPFYTIEEKRALRAAAELAGLKVLSLISDGLAVGLNYATSRQFPSVSDGAKPEYHMVFDMGAGSSKATVMRFQSRAVKDVGKFNKTVQEVQVLGSGWDRTLGGDALNQLIVDDMVSQFVESKGAQKVSATAQGVKSHGRAIAKLSKEAERLRHVLSANQNSQASFEGLYEDVDFKYKITRAEFETMAAGHVDRLAVAIDNTLKASGLEMGDIASVILHGGVSRTPFVQKALEKAVGASDKIRTNVNSDEAAVFGAGFRAAELSPSFRVKEIRISDSAAYPAGLKWTSSNGKAQRQRLWTGVSSLGGAAKEMSFNEPLDDFAVTIYQQFNTEDKDIRSFTTTNLTKSVEALRAQHPSCGPGDIQFKLALQLSSEDAEVKVSRAAVECEAEVTEKESLVDGVKNLFGFGKKDQQPLKDGESAETAEGSDNSEAAKAEEGSSSTASPETTTTSEVVSETPEASDAKTDSKKKEIVSIPVEFKTEPLGIPQLTKNEQAKSKDRLKAFAASDRSRMQREEALNRLEGYTYKVRDKLEDETFISMSTEAERAKIAEKYSFISEWLYDDGADATKDELKAKLKELEDLVSPVQKRVDESAERPKLLAELKEQLNVTNSFLDSIHKQIHEFEEWHASASASANEAKPTASETTAGEFDGLEDEDAPSGKARSMQDVLDERGPVPPLYERGDMEDVKSLFQSISAWLEEIEPRQEALRLTDEPVLLIKDMQLKREKLEKAGKDLAMRGVKNFERRSKESAKNPDDKKKKKKSSPKSSKSDDAEPAAHTIKLDDDHMITEEELEELLKRAGAESEKAKQEAGDKGDDKKRAHDEL